MPSAPAPGAPLCPRAALDFNDRRRVELESDLILQALEHTHWNKNRAAQLLGLNRTTLLEKIKKKRDRTPARFLSALAGLP